MLVQDEIEPLDDFLDDPQETVNLYELLDIPPDADIKRVRKRLGEMFLEAQNNVEHRNFRRRFYYRELMETVLPRARHHLLNVDNREEYDRSLGILPPLPPPPVFIPPPPLSHTTEATPSIVSTANSKAPPAAPPAVLITPPYFQSPSMAMPPLAAPLKPVLPQTTEEEEEEEEVDFSKFAPFVAPPTTGTAEAKTVPMDTVNSTFGTTAAAATQFSNDFPEVSPNVVPAVRRGGAPEHSRMDAERVERRRDTKRRELIKQELQSVGTKWATLSGSGAFIVVIAVLFGLSLAPGFSTFRILAAPIALGAAVLAARYAHREARKQIIILLSQMSYEQLLRRCARM